MWSGSIGSIPTGWRLCDGTGGTPDLRSRFVIGAGGTFAVGSNGGSATIAISNLPSHTHGVNDPGHAHSHIGCNVFPSYDAGGGQKPGSGSSLTTSNTTGITIQSTGGGVNYYPPFYALAYIMRTA